jgi:hypothetical protein
MDHITFDKIVGLAQKKSPLWFELSKDNRLLTTSEIEKIENNKNIIFDDQYKRFITKYGVGLFAFAEVYSPLLNGALSLWEEKSKYSLPANFIPISDNGCGDYLGFIINDGRCSVQLYWADHENNYSIEKVAYNSFYDFIIQKGLNVK